MELNNELQFAKEYLIKSYETDKNNSLRLITLMNIFQDMAGTHAYKMGVGIDYCIENQTAWVCSAYHIKIFNLPKMHEKVMVHTWPAVENKLSAIRDFVMLNKAGDVLVVASSQWVLLGLEKKRPLVMREALPDYKIFQQRALETDFPKIDNVERIDFETKFVARFDDIDLNHHVNNAVYALWASEGVSPDFRLSHSIEELEISFRREALFGEKIFVRTEMHGETSIHSVIARTDDRELAKCKIKWGKI